MKSIISFGNPLLDTTVNISDDSLLTKYNLKCDGQTEISENEMERLVQDIERLNKNKSPGGCGQNTMRVIQWILNKKIKTYVIGSVGDDAEAILLRDLLQQDGVQTRYVTQKGHRTGRTIALVNGPNRSLIAHLSAAQIFSLTDLKKSKNFHEIFTESHFVYLEAFFLTNRTETAKYIIDLCKKSDKKLIFNICGVYVFELVPDLIKYAVNNAAIVFGNKQEHEELIKLYESHEITRLNTGKIIIITNGANTVKCVDQTGEIREYHTEIVPENEFKDTIGAGDAFAAGFISGMCLSKNIPDCIKIGNYASTNIIKQTGCTLPKFASNIV